MVKIQIINNRHVGGTQNIGNFQNIERNKIPVDGDFLERLCDRYPDLAGKIRAKFVERDKIPVDGDALDLLCDRFPELAEELRSKFVKQITEASDELMEPEKTCERAYSVRLCSGKWRNRLTGTSYSFTHNREFAIHYLFLWAENCTDYVFLMS